jgi:hypothetical protein
MIGVREATEADAQVLAELNNAFNGVQRSAEQICAQMRAAEFAETILLADERFDAWIPLLPGSLVGLLRHAMGGDH